MTASMPSSPTEMLEVKRLSQAKEQGWSLFLIRPSDGLPGFCYSVGMAQHDLPEFLAYFNTEEEGMNIHGLMSNMCRAFTANADEWSKIQVLQAFCSVPMKATDPDVIYQPTFLRRDSFLYSLKTVLTRAVLFHKDLGLPRGVIELRRDGVMTIDQVRAQLMLKKS